LTLLPRGKPSRFASRLSFYHIYINFRKREISAGSKEGCTAGMMMNIIAIQN
jgi:hypothetical protein